MRNPRMLAMTLATYTGLLITGTRGSAKTSEAPYPFTSRLARFNGVCSLFADPKIREVFAPEPLFENFEGFDRLIEEGQFCGRPSGLRGHGRHFGSCRYDQAHRGS